MHKISPTSPSFQGFKGWMRMMACKGSEMLLSPTLTSSEHQHSVSLASTSTTSSSEKHHYTCETYGKSLVNHLFTLWTTQQLCDVELTAGHYKVKAHRCVLSAASPYFHAMFTGGMSEENMPVINMKNIEPHILSSLIRFMYTGAVEVTTTTVQELVIGADMLQIQEVVMICSNFFKKELAPMNAVGFFRFAEAHNLTEIQSNSWQYIEEHFPDVANEKEFLELPKVFVDKLLMSEHLKINVELQVLEAAIRWLSHDFTSREEHVNDILQNVRFSLIPSRLMLESIEGCSEQMLRSTLVTIEENQQRDGKNSLCSLLSEKPRLCARKKIYVMGGAKREFVGASHTRSECILESTVCLDTFTQEWNYVAPMDHCRIMPGTAVLNSKIYVIGGEMDSQILAEAEVYDPMEDEWHRIEPMVEPRCEFGLCVHDGYLYAFGGWVGDGIGGSIERYDPVNDTWALVGQMPESRFSMGVVEHEGLVYVVGGCTDSQRHRSDLLCYNPFTNTWTDMASMPTPRSRLSVAVLDGYLYAVGGTNRSAMMLNTVERYSFSENRWFVLPGLTRPRASPATAAVNSVLYVIGGEMSSETNDFFRMQVTMDSVEVYDPESDRWQEKLSLPESRSEAGVVVF